MHNRKNLQNQHNLENLAYLHNLHNSPNLHTLHNSHNLHSRIIRDGKTRGRCGRVRAIFFVGCANFLAVYAQTS